METQIFENIANEIVLFLIITAISIPFAVIKYFINRKLETFQNIYNKNQEKKTRKILPFLIASIVLIGVGCLFTRLSKNNIGIARMLNIIEQLHSNNLKQAIIQLKCCKIYEARFIQEFVEEIDSLNR